MNAPMLAAIAMLLCGLSAAPVLLERTSIHLPDLGLAFQLSWLFVGALIRRTIDDERSRVVPLLVIVAIGEVSATALLTGLAGPTAYSVTNLVPQSAFLAHVAATLVFGYAVVTGRPNGSFLVLVGTISYSLYLFHCLVARLLLRLVPATPVGVAVYAIATAGLSMLVA